MTAKAGGKVRDRCCCILTNRMGGKNRSGGRIARCLGIGVPSQTMYLYLTAGYSITVYSTITATPEHMTPTAWQTVAVKQGAVLTGRNVDRLRSPQSPAGSLTSEQRNKMVQDSAS